MKTQRYWRLITLLLLVVAAIAPGAHGEPLREGLRGPVEELFEKVIALRYACDTRALVELRMRNAGGDERRRSLQMVAKHLDGRLHSIGRLVAPEHLRGMTILSIEAPNRADDVFVYLPSLGRVRRVSMGRRGDSFLGSDLTYADFDRHRPQDYEIESLTQETIAGEPTHVITVRPRSPETYQRLAFVAARSDLALLELRYYKEGDRKPSRVVQFPRESIRALQGHLIPARILVVDALRGSETELAISNLEVNPEIDPRLFSLTTLETGRALGLATDARERTPQDTR